MQYVLQYFLFYKMSAHQLLLQIHASLSLFGLSAVVGGIVILLALRTLLVGIYARLLRSGKNILKKFGPWGKVEQNLKRRSSLNE